MSTLAPEQFEDRLAVRRRTKAFEALGEAIVESSGLEVPARVEQIQPRKIGVAPKLPAEAFELARQVYYLQHGTMRDAARAIIAAGLADGGDITVVCERLKTWWDRERWPKRQTLTNFAIRDANHDGGLFRSTRICAGTATGNGPAPKGKKCTQSALPDSDRCFHHDPRPEYVEARRQQAEKLRQGRRADMVPVEPLQRWLDAKRVELLEQAKASGRRVDPKNRGWGLLAQATGIDQSVITRIMQGRHNRYTPAKSRTIRAATVSRYVNRLGLTFRDVYGYDPPERPNNGRTCPECGGPKNHEGQTCRSCYEAAQGAQCTYINAARRDCPQTTKHPSGICAAHRKITERVAKPRPGRQTWVSVPMLILALGEYRDIPSTAWVSRRMWAANAGGCRDVFKSRKSLTSGLVKQLRKRDVSTVQDAERVYDQLVAEHGEVAWPQPGQTLDLEAAGMVPFAPFQAWLQARYQEAHARRNGKRGGYGEVAGRIRMAPDTISQWIRGTGRAPQTIRRATVDSALAHWGDSTTFADVYGSEPA